VTVENGGSLDMSGGTNYTLGGDTTLTVNGATTVAGPPSGTVTLAPLVIITNYQAGPPAITITAGTLSLNGNTFRVESYPSLEVSTNVLIQTSSTIAVTGSPSLDPSSSAIGLGEKGAIRVSNNVVYLDIWSIARPTTTTLGTVPSLVYGGTVLSATVVDVSTSTNVGVGTVTFKENSGTTVLGTVPVIDGLATLTINLPVNGGSQHGIQAFFRDTNVVYAASSSGTSNLVITPRPIIVTGSTTYNGLPMANLTGVVNNIVAGDDLTLSGTALLAGRNAGSEAIIGTVSNAPARVQVATGNPGGNAVTSFTVTLGSAPANGHTLIAVIGTRGSSTGRVTSITQTGVTWSRAAEAANANSSTVEVWYAPVGAAAGTVVTINQASLRSAAVVMEYSGVFTNAPVDQTASATDYGTDTLTGTTPTTTLPNELWIGGISYTNSGATLGTPLNSFNSVAVAKSTSTFGQFNAIVYALEKIVPATGAASSGGTVSTLQYWSGAIAAFRGVPFLTLGGLAAPNYTVAGVSGTVTVAPANLTVSAAAYSKTYDGTTNAVGTPTITAGSIQIGDTASGTWTEAFVNRNAGTQRLIPVGVTVNDRNSGLNYNYIYPEVTGMIYQTNLTVTAVSNTKTYDGNTTAAAVPTITAGSIQTGDTAPVWTETYDNASVGTGKTLTPAGVVLDGNSGLNYSYIYTPVFNGVINSSVIYSYTNVVLSISNNHNGTFKVNALGTPGAQYYLVASAVLRTNMTNWAPLADTTNTAGGDGKWSCTVTGYSVPVYYRSVAINPAP
jgi:hypothetical protein